MSMEDFWNCSLWEFGAAIEGWNRAQSGDDRPEPMTSETYDTLKKKYGYT